MKQQEPNTRKKIVAIACSTGGPRALQEVIPLLPENLNAPVLVVQHMPEGFTNTLAKRLDELSRIHVTEAAEGTIIQNGNVYIAEGGKHMKVKKNGSQTVIQLSDEPPRERVKPCANYMYESLCDCDYDEVICVVMTGMGADGTEGIVNLQKKKETKIIIQDKSTSIVYGMPGSIEKNNLKCKVLKLELIAKEIIENVGVN